MELRSIAMTLNVGITCWMLCFSAKCVEIPHKGYYADIYCINQQLPKLIMPLSLYMCTSCYCCWVKSFDQTNWNSYDALVLIFLEGCIQSPLNTLSHGNMNSHANVVISVDFSQCELLRAISQKPFERANSSGLINKRGVKYFKK